MASAVLAQKWEGTMALAVRDMDSSFQRLSFGDTFSVLYLKPLHLREEGRAGKTEDALSDQRVKNLIQRIMLLCAKILQIAIFGYLLIHQFPQVHSEDWRRALLSLVILSASALGLCHGVCRTIDLYRSTLKSTSDAKKICCSPEGQLQSLRSQISLAHQEISRLKAREILQGGELHLERLSAEILRKLLTVDRRDLMRSLAKALAARECLITSCKSIDNQSIVFLDTNFRASYDCAAVLKWLAKNPTCPTTRKRVQFVIAPHFRSKQVIDASADLETQKALKSCERMLRQEVKSFEKHEREDREKAIFQVNREFGAGSHYLTYETTFGYEEV